MKERPIIFSGPEVRATLDGRMTQIRRVMKPQPVPCPVRGGYRWWFDEDDSCWGETPEALARNILDTVIPPHGSAMDRLWVRETFKGVTSGETKYIGTTEDGIMVTQGALRYGCAYKADGTVIWDKNTCLVTDLSNKGESGPMQFKERKWSSPLHMPRRFSRLLLEITKVRVERVQEISEDDAWAGGVNVAPGIDPRDSFASLWYATYGDRPGRYWEDNPWVWAITFKVVEEGR